MIVISDTSSLSNFIKIGQLAILQKVYNNLLIPTEVYNELKFLIKLGFDMEKILSDPWIQVKQTFSAHLFFQPSEKIHLGEAAAISLAKELNASYILLDDRKAREFATKLKLHPLGTLGTLKIAKEKGIIALVKPLLDEMVSLANFWLSRRVYTEFLKNCSEL